MLNIGADAVVNDGQNHSTTIPFISYPLETGILTPGQKINCSPKGKISIYYLETKKK